MYTRYHFLQFDVPSIQCKGNEALYQRLRMNSQNQEALDAEVEEWTGAWSEYPHFPEIGKDTFHDENGHTLSFIAWLIHTFSGPVCMATFKRRRMSYPDMVESTGIEFLSLDDLVFIFVQVEHNINMWILLFDELKKRVPSTGTHLTVFELAKQKQKDVIGGDTDKSIKELGYEFTKGSMVSGVEGQKRYRAMTKYFYEIYYNFTDDRVNANRNALANKLKELIKAEMEMEEKNSSDGRAAPNNESDHNGKQARSFVSPDPHLDAILHSQFVSHLGGGGSGGSSTSGASGNAYSNNQEQLVQI